MAKKGNVAEKSIFYLIFGVVLTLIFFALVHIIGSYLTVSQSTPHELQNTIFVQRFINSPECFVFVDNEIGRSYPGILDWNKFTQKNLGSCFDAYDPYSSDNEKAQSGFLSQDATSVNTRAPVFYYTSKAFRLTLSLLDPVMSLPAIMTSGWKNETGEVLVKDVLVRYNSEIKQGKLKIEVSV